MLHLDHRYTHTIDSSNKTDRHDVTEILLKVVLNTILLTIHSGFYMYICFKAIYISV